MKKYYKDFKETFNETQEIVYYDNTSLITDMQASIIRRYQLPNDQNQFVVDGNDWTTKIKIRLKKKNVFDHSIEIKNQLDSLFNRFKEELQVIKNDTNIMLGYYVYLENHVKPNQPKTWENCDHTLGICLLLSVNDINHFVYEIEFFEILNNLGYTKFEPPYIIPNYTKGKVAILRAQYDIANMKENSYFYRHNPLKQYQRIDQ